MSRIPIAPSEPNVVPSPELAPKAPYKRPPRSRGNPDHSPWRSTPNAKRGRPMMGFTLPPIISEQIDALQALRGIASRSELVERLVTEAYGAAVSASIKK